MIDTEQYERLEYIMLDAGMLASDEGNQKSLFVFKASKNKTFPDFEVPIHQYLATRDESLLRNAFWLPNTGEQIIHWNIRQEGRKKFNICRYRFFYADFDLKDNNGNHFKNEQLIAEKNKLRDKIRTLPLPADYIIESRNGFHLYYTIPDKYSTMGDEKWTHIERGMFKHIYHNISTCVDPACNKANQLLRFPNSFHQKADDDDFFQVKIIHVQKESNRKQKGKYEPGTFAHPIENIIKAFQIAPELPKKVKKQSSNINAQASKKVSPKTDSTAKKLNFTKYPVIRAIANHDSNDICFAPLKQRYGFKMTRHEATVLIKSIDLRELLQVSAEPGKAFSSLFYTDENPSDYFKDGERISYVCRADKRSYDYYFYNDIFSIIIRVIYPDTFKDILTEDSSLHREEWRFTYDFVYAMLGIKILDQIDINAEKQKFEKTRANNITIFKQVASHSKKTKYLKGLVPIYEHLIDLWKKQSEENNTPWRETHRLLASTFLAKEFNVSRQKITRALLIFEFLGLIEKVCDSNIRRKEINNYSFNVLTNNDETLIIARAELIRDKFSKPREQVSRSNLNALFNDE